MKLRLIYDTSDNPEDKLDFAEDEDPGYCSDTWVYSKLPHESKSYYEVIYQQISKYFDRTYHTYNENTALIDIPDEIMLQYMLEGVYDWDYLAYDFLEQKMCLSNKHRRALRYGEEHNYGRVVGRGSVGANSASTEDQKFFKFDLNNTSKFEASCTSRESYSIVPDGEHYKNMHEAVFPYVQFKFIELFKISSDVIRSTQRITSGYDRPEPYGDYDAYVDDASSVQRMNRIKRVFLDDELGCVKTWNVSYETFIMCMNMWKNDHILFTSCRDHFSDYEIESFVLFEQKMRAKVSETKQ